MGRVRVMQKRVLIAGYYGFGNTGDEAILAAMLDELRALDPELVLLVISGNPLGTAAAHGVESIDWTDLASIIRAAEEADLILLGGGGVFHDYWGFDPDMLLD